MTSMLKPRDTDTENFNSQHWAYTWGVEVRYGTQAAPGENGLIGFDNPAFTPRAKWHYNLGRHGK